MAIEHPVLGQALGSRRHHVLLVDLLEEGVLGQHGEGGEGTHHHGDERQRHMPEVVSDAGWPGQAIPVVRDQAAQGEPLGEAPAGEQQDQQDGEEKGGNGVADGHDARGPGIEARSVAHRLGDAERDRDQVGDERGPKADRDRDRHLLDHEIDHRGIAEETLAEIEAGIVAQHDEVALQDRLVEAVVFLDPLDEGRVEAAGSAIGAGLVLAARGGGRPAAQHFASGPRDAGGRGLSRALELGQQLLHRAAGCHLDDEEVEGHDAEQGRHDEQQAANEVGEHRLVKPLPAVSSGRAPPGPCPSPDRSTRYRSPDRIWASPPAG